ncbi:serine/threonine protein kinase [Lachnospiraceae bacterium ZAX-1]
MLGSGGSSSVYLAEHIKLKAYRAIKCILKASSRQFSHLMKESFIKEDPIKESFIETKLKEANLLKNLRHSGIPIIYDIEEDESMFYIIEEYIQGESLHAFMQHHGNISQNLAISFGIQLCEILVYLHGQAPKPILYLDLKPEHIILCGNQIKLVDFGIATSVLDTGNICHSWGTKGFAAPEQYHGQNCNMQTDIYGIGVVLYFMLTNRVLTTFSGKSLPPSQFPNYCSKKFKHIIQKAAAPRREKRFQTVASLKEKLQQELEDQNVGNSSKHLLKKIIVAGSQKGIGATHFAISLVCYLNRKGNTAIYEEKNNDQILQEFMQYNNGFCETEGMIQYGTFKLIPNYGSGVTKNIPRSISQECIFVQDYGNHFSEVVESESTDLVCLVVGGQYWEIKQVLKAYEKLRYENNLKIICNYNNKKMARDYAKLFQRQVFCYPLDLDIYQVSKEKERLFEKLL